MKHKFVEYIPAKKEMEENTLYISMDSGTVIHKCDCGCGNEVVTPLSPTDWKLTYDGKTITLDPSIGNWNFNCRSHYWIRNSEVVYAGEWSKSEIYTGRKYDKRNKKEYYGKKTPHTLPTSKKYNNTVWEEVVLFFKELFGLK
jgi:hypothetical protein